MYYKAIHIWISQQIHGVFKTESSTKVWGWGFYVYVHVHDAKCHVDFNPPKQIVNGCDGHVL